MFGSLKGSIPVALGGFARFDRGFGGCLGHGSSAALSVCSVFSFLSVLSMFVLLSLHLFPVLSFRHDPWQSMVCSFSRAAIFKPTSHIPNDQTDPSITFWHRTPANPGGTGCTKEFPEMAVILFMIMMTVSLGVMLLGLSFSVSRFLSSTLLPFLCQRRVGKRVPLL